LLEFQLVEQRGVDGSCRFVHRGGVVVGWSHVELEDKGLWAYISLYGVQKASVRCWDE